MTNRTIIKVGRSSDCHFQLNSQNVSSEHAWLVVGNNAILLIDCCTTNGTRLKSQGLKKISQTLVSAADTIFFADQEVQVSEILRHKAFKLPSSQSSKGEERGTRGGSKRGVISTLIEGDYGLAKTYWLFGVIGSTVLGFPLAFISQDLLLVFCLPLLSYSGVILLATWRAATKYRGPVFWAILAKIATILGWIQVASACAALIYWLG